MAKPDGYWDPMRQCEAVGGCREYTGLRLVPVVGADGKRTYHWFCELHRA